MNNEMIKVLYHEYVNSDEYNHCPEIQETKQRDSAYIERARAMMKDFPTETAMTILDDSSTCACEDEKTGFILGFKYACKLMAEVYGGTGGVKQNG